MGGFYPQPQPAAGYGNVYYNASHGGDVAQASHFERQRGIQALNDFLGEVKRRQFDPASYAEVGQRLLQLQALPLPIPGGADYRSGALMGSTGVQSVAMAQPQYSLPPMPNRRTKNDLLNIDQFLEQMQSTVYENPSQPAAAGVGQPGAHYGHEGLNFRSSQSPPPYPSTMNANGTQMMAPGSSTSANGDTPALTPSSSSISYTSGHSPVSLPSVHGMSPDPRAVAGMYPSLPAISGAADLSGSYSTASSTAPPSTLGSVFDNDPRRRFSGGQLQAANRSKRTNNVAMDTDEDTATPRASTPSVHSNIHMPLPPSVIDPALSDHSSNKLSADLESADDKRQEIWVGNMRLVEGLRKHIQNMIQMGAFKDEDDESMEFDHEDAALAQALEADIHNGSSVRQEKAGRSLYPVLKTHDDHQ
jgi:hypothetical protein